MTWPQRFMVFALFFLFIYGYQTNWKYTEQKTPIVIQVKEPIAVFGRLVHKFRDGTILSIEGPGVDDLKISKRVVDMGDMSTASGKFYQGIEIRLDNNLYIWRTEEL